MKTYKFGDTSVFLHKNDLPNSVEFPCEVSIDTETTGLNLNRDRLCLIQIGFSKKECHLVKFDVSYFQKNNTSTNLLKLFKNRDIKKIFHYARFDLSVIQKSFDVKCKNFFCTKIASKLVRTYTDRHGLKDLCRELLGKEISKVQQSSDWSLDSLTDSQIKYASHDVIFLFELKKKLETMLMRENRLKLSQKIFDFLETRIELDFLGWNDIDIFSH